jgi:thiol:disulfide interchange protein DsbD
LASVLAYVATTRSVALGGSLLFTYALGMGLLFFAIAAFAVSLPRSGAWMEAVKSIFGVIMTVAALYFLRNVVGPLARYGAASQGWLVSHVAVLVAGVVIGGIHLTFHDPGLVRLRKAVGLLAITVGGFGVIGWLLTPKDFKLVWVKGEKAGLAAAQAAHQPALLDFYADWCLPCKEMELKTFNSESVAAQLQHLTLVKIDTTNDDDPEVAATKQRYGAATLPTVVLLDSAGKVAHKLDHFVEPKELLPLIAGLK